MLPLLGFKQKIMGEDLQTGFLLLGVGMITVFAILSLVVWSGQILIWATNRFVEPKNSFVDVSSKKTANNKIQEEHIAVITSVVEVVTQGKGRVQSINKTNH